MVVAVVIAGTVAVLAGLLALARWRAPDGPLPLFVTDERCPVCGHHIRDHLRSARLSRVFRGCDVSGCECATPITRMPG